MRNLHGDKKEKNWWSSTLEKALSYISSHILTPGADYFLLARIRSILTAFGFLSMKTSCVS